jgi:hypothetical protein
MHPAVMTSTREAVKAEGLWWLLVLPFALAMSVVLIVVAMVAGDSLAAVFPGHGEHISRAVVIVGLFPCAWYGERVCVRASRWMAARGAN